MPLPLNDPNSPVATRDEGLRPVDDYDGDNDSSPDDKSEISNMKSDPPRPDNVDKLQILVLDPTSQSTLHLPRTGEDSQASPAVDLFVLALRSKHTCLAPVVVPITCVSTFNIMAACDKFLDFEVITLNCQGQWNFGHRDTLFS